MRSEDREDVDERDDVRERLLLCWETLLLSKKIQIDRKRKKKRREKEKNYIGYIIIVWWRVN